MVSMRFAHGMELPRHRAIIANDEILVRSEGDGRPVPVAGKLDVRFFQRLAIDDDFAVEEGDGFAGETDDAFHIGVAGKGDAGVGEADEDHIATAGPMKEIGETIHDVDAVVLVCGNHALTIDSNRQRYETEE